MKPVEHVVTDAAIKAKKAAGYQPVHLSHPPSTASRGITAAIWLLAIGSIVALFWMR